MADYDYGKFMQYTMNTLGSSLNSQGNTGATGNVDKTAQIIQAASDALAMFFQLGENEKAVSEEERKRNNIEKSSKKVREITDQKVAEYTAEINALKEKIEENLKKTEDANEEKTRIEESLKCEVETIKEAQQKLNDPNTSQKDRLNAINTLRVSGEVIKGLSEASAKLSETIQAAAGEIEDYQSQIGALQTNADEAVDDANAELEAYNQQLNQSKKTNQQLTVKAVTEVVQGDKDIALGTMTENAAMVNQGREEVTEGTETQTKAKQNITNITSTYSQIKTDLTQFSADKVGIGSACSELTGISEQIQGVWGVIGTWTEEYSNTLKEQVEVFNEAVDSAAKAVSDKDIQETKSETENNDENNQDNVIDSDKKDNLSGNVFNYDTSVLEALKPKQEKK